MAYATKYKLTQESVTNKLLEVDLMKLDYVGDATTISSAIRGVELKRDSSGQRLYGVFGTAFMVKLVCDGDFDPEEFVANSFKDWKAEVTFDGQLMFVGYIVPSDIRRNYRVKPYEVDIVFSDNLGQLTEVDFPYPIADTWHELHSIFGAVLAQTGLELPMQIYHSPYPETAVDTVGALKQTKVLTRSWAESLRKFKASKEFLSDVLESLRMRLFQYKGKWVLWRVHDFVYTGIDGTYNGFEYAYGTLTETPCSEVLKVTGLEPLRFSQTITHKRAKKSVARTYKYEAPFLLLNSDLQDVGGVLGTYTDADGNTVTRYSPVHWTSHNGMSAEIVVARDADDTEVYRRLYLPFVASNSLAANGARVLSAPILAGKGDTFELSITLRGEADSNFAGNFVPSFFLVGNDGNLYRGDATFSVNTPRRAIEWNIIGSAGTFTPQNTAGGNLIKRYAGSDNLTEEAQLTISDFADLNAKPIVNRFPVNGLLYIAFFGFNNVTSRRADIGCYISDIEFTYTYLANEVKRVDGHERTASQVLDSLNVDKDGIAVDDSPRYNTKGALYDASNDNTVKWLRFAGDLAPASIGEINVREQLQLEGDRVNIISGEWRGQIDFFSIVEILAGEAMIPSRMSLDFHTEQHEIEFVSLQAFAGTTTYDFKYLYSKSN